MKTLSIINTLLLVLFITGCDDPNDTSTSSPSDNLLGDWLYTYPNQCVEEHSFNSNNEWNVSALDELAGGTYVFTENNSGGNHSLSLIITRDNGLPDCDGNSEVILGNLTVFVVFPTNTSMEWYLNESDTAAKVTLTKQL